MLEYDVREFSGRSPMSIGIKDFSASAGDRIKIEEISVSDQFGGPCTVNSLMIDGFSQFCTSMHSSVLRCHRHAYRSYSKDPFPSLTENQKAQVHRECLFNSQGPLRQDWKWIDDSVIIMTDAGMDIAVTIGFRRIPLSHVPNACNLPVDYNHDPDRANKIENIKDRVRNFKEGIPILLRCPACHERHIDEGEWVTRPHHTHACQYCGEVWRPAILNTVGVKFLPGFKNE